MCYANLTGGWRLRDCFSIHIETIMNRFQRCPHSINDDDPGVSKVWKINVKMPDIYAEISDFICKCEGARKISSRYF